ncbi:MAG: Rrf2 family transcriptional regulator [Bacillaceae bacterium]|nr:Rrf2 family transcriptional regulator [Bacillaceae bacterium]
MRLTSFTEYSLRVLLYLGTRQEGKLSSIKEISSIYQISPNHLSKIVYELGKLGLIQTIRGRNGGIRLARSPDEINIGWVVRQTEEDFHQAACFDESGEGCVISSACKLKSVLSKALHAYLHVLDSYTLGDLLINQNALQIIFDQSSEKE